MNFVSLHEFYVYEFRIYVCTMHHLGHGRQVPKQLSVTPCFRPIDISLWLRYDDFPFFLLDMIRILNVSLVGAPVGLTVRVMCLTDLFPYLTAVSLVHHIYTSCKPHGRAKGLVTEEREGSLYSLRFNSLIIAKIVDWRS
jgi:hypothetical protein